ncbi:MAG: hypothetical protein M1486_07125 [Gammaproteobacteria bacterium]|nr:hypothetical protein [Gammaproteobacteria bacterium]
MLKTELTKEEDLVNERIKADIVGEEQFSEKELDKKLLNFAKKFFNYPVEERRKVLFMVEKAAAAPDDEDKHHVVQFFRDLCEEANRRDVERYGA